MPETGWLGFGLLACRGLLCQLQDLSRAAFLSHPVSVAGFFTDSSHGEHIAYHPLGGIAFDVIDQEIA